MKDAFANRPTTLADYVAVLRRRKWIVIALPVVAALSAFLVSKTESSLYRATATVLVNRTNVVTAITGINDPAVGDPTRFLATQASVARAPELANRVASSARVPGVTAGRLLASSSVSPQSSADLLDVSVSWPNPDEAVKLSNTYAHEFTRYKTQLDTKRVNQALAKLRAQINELKASKSTASPDYGTLLQYQSQLETVGTLLANNTSVLQPAEGAVKVRPQPTRRALLGGVLGLVLGVALAFLAETFDRRVRSEEELEEVLDVPLIARIPTPPRRVRDVNDLVTVLEPEGIHAESFRKLKTSLEFLNLSRQARTIMLTSAVPREGKSTTTANLGVAFARSGRRVSLVDLDLRQPFLHRFFQTGIGLGVTDIVTGDETVDGALRTLALVGADESAAPSRNGRRARVAAGANVDKEVTLTLLPAGTVPPAGRTTLVDFLENDRLTSMLEEIAARSDLVLVDSPPLLSVGDALALTSKVDAVVVVLHAGVERPIVKELARQLQASRAPVLGFVLTGVVPGEAEGYPYGYAYGYGYGNEARATNAPTRRERRAGRL